LASLPVRQVWCIPLTDGRLAAVHGG
jgi:hypothetical protein